MSDEHQVRALLHMITGHVQPSSLDPRVPGNLPSAARVGAATGMTQAPGPAAILDWAADPNIRGFGVGEKETRGVVGSDVALKVYVEKKQPIARIGKPVPKVVSMDGLDPLVTDVVEIGEIRLQSNTQRVRPALPGFSVSRAEDQPNTGTFGMVVRQKGQASPFYLLSNCHAIAASGLASKGDVIIQPGAADQGVAETDRIGTLADWVPFDFTPNSLENNIDAAIARLDDNAASAAIALLGVPTGVNKTLSRGMYVQKIGRTTSHSVARITDVDLVLNLTYPTASGLKVATLRDQVLVTFYSAPGDSGSAVLDMNNNVVGLHVGGSAVVGFFCKIGNILDRLGLEVVTQDNPGSPATTR